MPPLAPLDLFFSLPLYLSFLFFQIFRNEVMDTVPQELTVDWFVKLPRRGIIRYRIYQLQTSPRNNTLNVVACTSFAVNAAAVLASHLFFL